jgi:hypothetical protein
MPKSHYINFTEYAANDHNYLMRVLRDELHRPQSKIEFRDGTTYHVTRSGTRYWELHGRVHREDGPCAQYQHGSWYALYGVSYTEEDHARAAQRLQHLRAVSDNTVESLINNIANNMSWELKQQFWRSILLNPHDASDMISQLRELSSHYARCSVLSQEFIQRFSYQSP